MIKSVYIGGFWFFLFWIILFAIQFDFSWLNKDIAEAVVFYNFIPLEFWAGVSSLADFVPATFISLFIVSFAIALKQYNFFIYFSVTMISGVLIMAIFTFFVYIPRPVTALECAFIKDSTFPSGHVFTSLILLGAIYQGLKVQNEFLLLFIGIFIIFMGISRITLGCHWPLDVLGSIFLGLFLLQISEVFRHYFKI